MGLKTYSTTWADWVTATRQDYLARRKSAQLTEEKGFSGWPTPAAHEPGLGYQNRNNGKKGSQKSLTTVVIEAGQPIQANPSTDGKNPEQWPTPSQVQNWPTPDTQNHRDGTVRRKDSYGSHGVSLHHKIAETESWPTVCAGDYRTPPTNSGIKGQKVMPSSEHALPKKAGGKLNPNWVEQLMGLDPGRTQLPTEWTG